MSSTACKCHVAGGVPRIVLHALLFLQSLAGHQSAVESVSFDTNEEVVAAGAQSGSIKLFDLEQAKGEPQLQLTVFHVEAAAATVADVLSWSLPKPSISQ